MPPEVVCFSVDKNAETRQGIDRELEIIQQFFLSFPLSIERRN